MLIRLTFGVIFTFSLPMSTPRTPEESFKPLQGCLRCMVGSSIMGVKSPRPAGGGHDVRCLHGVVADCSRHRWDRSSWFCVRSGMWITTIIQLRMWTLGLRTRRRRRKPHILTYLVVCHQRQSGKLLKKYCNACRYMSDGSQRWEDEETQEAMICTRSEAHDADGGLLCTTTTPQTSCNLFD